MKPSCGRTSVDLLDKLGLSTYRDPYQAQCPTQTLPRPHHTWQMPLGTPHVWANGKPTWSRIPLLVGPEL